jgi:maleate isomerase
MAASPRADLSSRMAGQAAAKKRIGVVLPSSNTVLEPLIQGALAGTGITAHFTRLGVVDVTLDAASMAQFEMQKHLEAARLLADAAVDVLIWGGTSSSWLGVARDREWCDTVQRETGIPAGTCVLEMNRRLIDLGVSRIGLVTPYTLDVQHRIIANYKGMGFECVGHAHHGGTLSKDYAAISPASVAQMVRRVAQTHPRAILIMCTNLHGAEEAAALEAELGIPVIDSAMATLWAGLRQLTL